MTVPHGHDGHAEEVANEKKLLIVSFIIVIVTVIGFAFYLMPARGIGYSPTQPIPFSHELHVGQRKMQCLYCHSNVEKSPHANVPSTKVCLNCHRFVKTDSPWIKMLQESEASGKPVQWVNVHVLPDFVYFNHQRHVLKGVACDTCHGNIPGMAKVEQVAPLDMGWCVNCHRKPENQAPLNCNTCHRQENFMSENQNNKPKYWLSLEQLENPGPVPGEFSSSPIREGFEKESLGRRDFLKIMGAGAAMAGLAGCTRRPVQKIVPYVNNPEEIIPGVPNFYASACPETGYGLILKTREGRPIKVDGNADYPVNRGALGTRGQASVHDLYDPDRLRAPKISGKEVDWTSFDEQAKQALAQSRGQTYLLTATNMSPSLGALVAKLGFKHVQVDPVPQDDVLDGQEESFGTRVFPRYRFDKANVIVSIDADFLDTWGSNVEYTAGFAKGRKLDASGMSKFYAFESMMRLTGQNADERFAIKPQDQLPIALGIAAEVAKTIGRSSPELSGFSAASVHEKTGIPAEKIVAIARDLAKSRGKSLVVAGGNVAKGSAAVALQNVVNFINSILGNDGETVDGTLSPSRQFQGSTKGLQKLIADMNSGSVKTLLIQGVNPLYQFPNALGFKAALGKVANVIYVTKHFDETAAACKFVAAESHSFEAWGDVSAQKDLFAIAQPTIRPLWKTKSLMEMMIDWAPGISVDVGAATAHEYIQNQWKDLQRRFSAGGAFTKFWEDTLQAGVFDPMGTKRAGSGSSRGFKGEALKSAVAIANNQKADAKDLSLVLFADSAMMGDGAQANNAILLELPDPVTKNTWGNYLSMSPATAKAMGIEDGQFVNLSIGGKTVKMTAHRQPGLKAGVLAAALGYGRNFPSRVAKDVGVSLLDFVALAANGAWSLVVPGVALAKAGGSEKIPCTQGHHSLEGRDILFETTEAEFKENPKSGIVRHFPDPPTIWSTYKYDGYRWGMTIDLNSCTGCSACVVACSVENNVPAVGKDQVQRGREMQWIRIDRYYKGDEENPDVVFQPMLCQHCENAPCETVCPVLATTHSSEGLNQMTYNRCVGTKYCSNNCPYKVRRFNWYENNAPMNAPMEHPLPLMKNPEVTLRSRGVMEKCTFCVQRIESAKQSATVKGKRVEESELRTACQDACPADAISFGDINDTNTRVHKLQKDPRGFTSLEELNVKPAIVYLTKVRNRAPGKSEGHGGEHDKHHG